MSNEKEQVFFDLFDATEGGGGTFEREKVAFATEPPIEKVESFETLDQYAQMHRTQEESPSDFSIEGGTAVEDPSLELGEPPVLNPLGPPEKMQDKGPSDLFDLKINGPLSQAHQEKILDLVERTGLGIRPMDLELPFAVGRVLIPQITEYVGVYWIQALRDLPVQMQFALSSGKHVVEEEGFEASQWPEKQSVQSHSFLPEDFELPPPEKISVTFLSEERLLDASFERTDLVIVSGVCRRVLGAGRDLEDSFEYLSLLEKLKRQIKYQAYYRKAKKVVEVQIQIQKLGFVVAEKEELDRVFMLGVIVPSDGALSEGERGIEKKLS